MGDQFRTLGIGGSGRMGAEGDQTVIPVTKNFVTTLRSLVEHLNRKGVLGLAIDSPRGPVYTTELMGRTVSLTAWAPKLIRNHAAASFWCLSTWRGDRIAVELERLPDPRENESDEDWSRRWFDAYIERLARVWSSDPANIAFKERSSVAGDAAPAA
jgi:lauroyl/myristoyl acyltransferase